MYVVWRIYANVSIWLCFHYFEVYRIELSNECRVNHITDCMYHRICMQDV